MNCDFTPFSTVFQSYQDNGWVIIKGCVPWNLVYGWEIFRLKRDSNPGNDFGLCSERYAENLYMYFASLKLL